MLQPGGIVRLIVPDAAVWLSQYTAGLASEPTEPTDCEEHDDLEEVGWIAVALGGALHECGVVLSRLADVERRSRGLCGIRHPSLSVFLPLLLLLSFPLYPVNITLICTLSNTWRVALSFVIFACRSMYSLWAER